MIQECCKGNVHLNVTISISRYFRIIDIFDTSSSPSKISRFWSIDIFGALVYSIKLQFRSKQPVHSKMSDIISPFRWVYIFEPFLYSGQNKKFSKSMALSIFWTFERKISKLCWSNCTIEFDVVWSNRDGTNSNWFCKSVLLQRWIYFFTYQNHPLTHWFRG